ncbi:uncharacterized protein LOC129957654 [Argiope bruennichi]|uniref:uncharacterized protein LOC129957654 n=1 Tax=Argiope bruennichi TaxID=94029 RepID=UPI0024941F52|nr:uncharacterized protein LOC129957654 [Argiope bruennichi]
MKGSTQTKINELKSPDHSYKSSIGSVGSIPCEKYLHSPQRDFSLVIENPHARASKGKYISKGYSAWLVFKSAVFLVCLTICFYQSVHFYKHYYTYPLTTGIIVINPKNYKIPAITFCVRSPFKLRDFCKKHPTLCERPIDVAAFCDLYKHYCKGDPSKLTIPKTGHFTTNPTGDPELEKFLFHSFRYYNITGGDSPVIMTPKVRKNAKYTVVENPFEHELRQGKFMRCFSYNLHLMSNTEPEVVENETNEEGNLKIVDFLIYSQLKDVFFAWSQDQVFFSVHSPFVPVNPLTEGDSLEPGFKYNVYIRLEEEHLRPPPYTTNCTDYIDLWNRNNRTGARSQEMCKTICYLSYTRKCFGCEKAKLILYDPENLCPERLNTTGCPYKFYAEVEPCKRRCKPSCVKLKYHYSVKKIETSEKRKLYHSRCFC